MFQLTVGVLCTVALAIGQVPPPPPPPPPPSSWVDPSGAQLAPFGDFGGLPAGPGGQPVGPGGLPPPSDMAWGRGGPVNSPLPPILPPPGSIPTGGTTNAWAQGSQPAHSPANLPSGPWAQGIPGNQPMDPIGEPSDPWTALPANPSGSANPWPAQPAIPTGSANAWPAQPSIPSGSAIPWPAQPANPSGNQPAQPWAPSSPADPNAPWAPPGLNNAVSNPALGNPGPWDTTANNQHSTNQVTNPDVWNTPPVMSGPPEPTVPMHPPANPALPAPVPPPQGAFIPDYEPTPQTATVPMHPPANPALPAPVPPPQGALIPDYEPPPQTGGPQGALIPGYESPPQTGGPQGALIPDYEPPPQTGRPGPAGGTGPQTGGPGPLPPQPPTGPAVNLCSTCLMRIFNRLQLRNKCRLLPALDKCLADCSTATHSDIAFPVLLDIYTKLTESKCFNREPNRANLRECLEFYTLDGHPQSTYLTSTLACGLSWRKRMGRSCFDEANFYKVRHAIKMKAISDGAMTAVCGQTNKCYAAGNLFKIIPNTYCSKYTQVAITQYNVHRKKCPPGSSFDVFTCGCNHIGNVMCYL